MAWRSVLRHSGKCLEGILDILESSGFPNFGAHRKHLEGLWGHRLLGPIPEIRILDLGRPESSHCQGLLVGGSCCWSGHCTWRTTSLIQRLHFIDGSAEAEPQLGSRTGVNGYQVLWLCNLIYLFWACIFSSTKLGKNLGHAYPRFSLQVTAIG